MTIIRPEDNANVFRKDSRDDRASESFRETKRKRTRDSLNGNKFIIIRISQQISMNMRESWRIRNSLETERNRENRLRFQRCMEYICSICIRTLRILFRPKRIQWHYCCSIFYDTETSVENLILFATCPLWTLTNSNLIGTARFFPNLYLALCG